MLTVIEGRGLDVELLAKFGFDSEVRKWPVTGERGETTWHPAEALVIPFIRDGQVVRRKFKRTEHVEGAPTYLQEKGGPRLVFNEDCLRDDSLRGQDVLITEGELDAMAAIQCNHLRTISAPDGAPPPGDRSKEDLEGSPKYAWLDHIKPLLTKDRAPVIILAADGDENGAAMLQDLSILLGRFRCKFLTYPLAKDPEKRGRARLKDLNEVLEDYGPAGVSRTIAKAEFIKVDGIYRMSSLPPMPEPPVYDIGFDLLSQNWKVRPGDLSVITGVPGLGKSTFANDVFCRLALKHDLNISWASFEQTPQTDHRRALRAWYRGMHDFATEHDADIWIDQRHSFIVPDEDADVTLDWMLDRIEAAVVQFGANVVVIDPWNEMDHAREGHETTTEYVGRAIKTLRRFAKKFAVHICVIAHPTKSTKDADGRYRMPTLYDISDSAHWYNKCSTGIIVHREDEDTTLIKVQKSKYHLIIGRPGEVKMHYQPSTYRFIETERAA